MTLPSLHSISASPKQNKFLRYMKSLDGKIVIGTVLFVTFFWWTQHTDKPTSDKHNQLSKPYSSASCVSLFSGEKNHSGGFKRDNSVHRGKVDETDFLWQLPDGEEKPKAIFFGGHGCSHSMTDWWPSTSSQNASNDDNHGCPECIGLPEELAIVKIALEDFHMLVVTISSIDRDFHKCWSPEDAPLVAKVLVTIQECLGSGNDVPIIAFGASSGGHFVSSMLPKAMEQIGRTLHGYISQIAATPRATPLKSVFITMNRDVNTDATAKKIVESFRQLRVPAKHIRLDPVPIEPDFYSDRIPIVESDLSKQMVQDLKDAKLIDDNGLLEIDPRKSDWRPVLQKHADKINDSMIADASPISEVMNVAWGMHEMARDGVKDALDFLMKDISTTKK